MQCHFLSTNTLQKKQFFKLINLLQIRLKLNKKRLQTSTDSSVVDCTACPLFFEKGGGAIKDYHVKREGLGGFTMEGAGLEGITVGRGRGLKGLPQTSS